MWFSCATTSSILFVAAVVLASAPQGNTESICTLSDSETCAVESLTSPSADGSVLVYPGGDTRCAFDNYQDSTTGFTTNSTYFFQVFPNTNLDKSKLLIFSKVEVVARMIILATVRGAGVIDRFMMDNMFKDWNVVFVPYCTGDVHVGNKVLPPFESGFEQQLGNPQCLGKNLPMHMNGYNNSKAALGWALQNFPDVENLVVGGASAGSLGAQFFSSHIAEMWDVDAKGTRFSIMADSYVGVLPDSRPLPVLLEYFGACDNGRPFPADVAAICGDGNASTTEVVEALIEDKPDTNWLFINSKGDDVQRYYYALVKESIQGYPFPNLMSEEDLYRNMSAILEAYQTVSPRITTFYVEGDHHVFLMEKNFTSYKSDKDLLLGDVINEWLSSNSSLNLDTVSAEIEIAPKTSGTTL